LNLVAREIIGIVCGVVAVFLLVLPSVWRSQHSKKPKAKDIESRLIRIETNINWLIRIAGIQFAFLSALAFMS